LIRFVILIVFFPFAPQEKLVIETSKDESLMFHKLCFKCSECQKSLTLLNFTQAKVEGRVVIYCALHKPKHDMDKGEDMYAARAKAEGISVKSSAPELQEKTDGDAPPPADEDDGGDRRRSSDRHGGGGGGGGDDGERSPRVAAADDDAPPPQADDDAPPPADDDLPPPADDDAPPPSP